MEYEELIKAALKAREFAYVPYSNFKVGAAIITEDDKIYTGCNIENASYGATNCAERTAIFKAVSEGHKKIKAIAVVGSDTRYTYPCGICRQVINEFAENSKVPVIIAVNENEYIVKSIEEILPGAFSIEDLQKQGEC